MMKLTVVFTFAILHDAAINQKKKKKAKTKPFIILFKLAIYFVLYWFSMKIPWLSWRQSL